MRNGAQVSQIRTEFQAKNKTNKFSPTLVSRPSSLLLLPPQLVTFGLLTPSDEDINPSGFQKIDEKEPAHYSALLYHVC